VVLVIGFAIFSISGTPTTRSPNVPAPGGTTPTEGTQTPAQETKPLSQQTTPPAPSTNKFLTPAKDAKWVIGQNNLVSWSKAVGFPGAVSLADAVSNQTVGWILSSTDPQQTSFLWNTKEVSVSRSGGLKKDIPSGDYFIKITFDGARPAFQSDKFSVVLPTEVQIPIHTVTIQNYAFSPTSVAVKQGSKVMFVNNDVVKHRVISTNFGPYELAPGESYTLDTARLTPAVYFYYDDLYPYMGQAKLEVTK